jgi:hypothetical protein
MDGLNTCLFGMSITLIDIVVNGDQCIVWKPCYLLFYLNERFVRNSQQENLYKRYFYSLVTSTSGAIARFVVTFCTSSRLSMASIILTTART